MRRLTELPRRTQGLAVAAAGLVALLLISLLLPGEGSPTVGGGGTQGPAQPNQRALPGAPPDLDQTGLEKRYKPVVAARLFVERSFRDPPRGGDAPPVARPTPPAAPSGPEPLTVRLTGVVGSGPERCGVLEAAGTGKGLLAGGGKQLGDLSVAAVHTDSMVLQEGETQRTLALGEVLTLPASLRSSLVELRPPTPAGLMTNKGSTSGAAGAPAVELSQEKRSTILERLRAQRQASMGGKVNSDEGK